MTNNTKMVTIDSGYFPFYRANFWDEHNIMHVTFVDNERREKEKKKGCHSEVVAEDFIIEKSHQGDVIGFEVMQLGRKDPVDVNSLKDYLEKHDIDVSGLKNLFKIISEKFPGNIGTIN